MAGITNRIFSNKHNAKYRVRDFLEEVSEKTTLNNQHEVLSSTTKGLFSQKEYFNQEVASEDNTGYKILRKGQIVLSPQNLYMGNINYNDNFPIGIVSPSYKTFEINSSFNKTYIAYMMKTHRALYMYMSVSEQGASVVRRNLNMDDFLDLQFEIHRTDLQDKIAYQLQSIANKISLEEKILQGYINQKSGFLSKMFI